MQYTFGQEFITLKILNYISKMKKIGYFQKTFVVKPTLGMNIFRICCAIHTQLNSLLVPTA